MGLKRGVDPKKGICLAVELFVAARLFAKNWFLVHCRCSGAVPIVKLVIIVLIVLKLLLLQD